MKQRKSKISGILIVFAIAWGIILGRAIAAPARTSENVSPFGAGAEQGLLSQLKEVAGSKLQVTPHALTGRVRYIGVNGSGTIPQPSPLQPQATPEEAARGFLSAYGPLFGLKDPGRELTVMRTKTADRGRSFVRFQQVHSGVPILGGELILQVAPSKDVVSAHGKILPDLSIDPTPTIAPEVAAEKALRTVLKAYGSKYNLTTSSLDVSTPELWIYNPIVFGINWNFPRLVWRMEVNPKELLPIRELVLVDAHLGMVALNFNQVNGALYRKIYDHANTPGKPLPGDPGDLKRSEGGPASGIADVDNAYLYLGDTYTFYWNYFWRDSIDNAGMQVVATTHYCPSVSECPYPYAFWNDSQVVFGQGVPSADDLVAHEMTHGLIQNESNLFWWMQSGAINEAFSDIFGEFVDLTNGHGNDDPGVRWLIGEDLSGGAIRDMENPPVYDQPDRMTSANYYCGGEDDGGVHTNSGVANKAAYLMTDGDTFNGITVTGIGITKVAKIFYEAQVHLLTSASDYADLYDALRQACLNLVGTSGITSSDCQQVENAVNAVEMNQQPSACMAKEAPICESGKVYENIFFDDLENPSSGNWVHAALAGTDQWSYPQPPYATYATSGQYNFWGYNDDSLSDSYIAMSFSTGPLPQRAYLHFRHAYSFDYTTGPVFYDGGVIEYSVDNGATWIDAGAFVTHNGYTGTLATGSGNPLGGRRAFVGNSRGYISTRLDLRLLAGQQVRFRFRMGSDSSNERWGWFIDDIRIYTCTPSVCTELGFRDDFNFASSNWFDDGSGLWSVTGGNYVSSGAAPASVVTLATLYNGTYCDFTYEAKVRRTLGTADYSMGLVFRASNPKYSYATGYAFVIATNGKYSLRKFASGTLTMLIDWTSSPLINTGFGAWNTLKVEVSGSTIKVYVNGTQLGSVTDSTYSSGRVGLWAADVIPYSVEFDYAEVSNIPIPCSQYGFHDDFDYVTGNWADDGSGRWSVTGGVYKMTGTGASTWAGTLYNSATYCDFTYQVKLRKTNAPYESLGLLFRANNPDPWAPGAKGYRFVINGPNYGLWIELGGGAAIPLIYWTPSPAINTELGSWNMLKVEVSGTTIKLYVNETLLNTVTDSSYSSGKVALVAVDYPGLVVEYDFAEATNLPYACSQFGFKEDFNDGVANNWFDDKSGRWSVSSGHYKMTGAFGGSGGTLYDTSYCNFSYQVKIKRTDGYLGNLMGLLFRADNPNPDYGNGYLFTISGYGHYALQKVTGGGIWTSIIPITYSSAINTGLESWNILKVEAYGSTIKLYANGILLNTITDSTFSSGKVGLMVYDTGTDVIEFDFAEVEGLWGCENAIPLTAGVPYNGTTVGAPSVVTIYGDSYRTESGPERIHRITTYTTGTITGALTNLSSDLDVLILDACDPDSVVDFGDTAAAYINAPPGTYYIVVDGFAGASGPYTLTVTATSDTSAPIGLVLINGGDQYTKTTSVTLTISATDTGSGVSLMRFSNDGSTWSDWEVYNTSRNWTLTSGDGTKTVYVQFQDNAGNTSGYFTDTVWLDTIAPTGSISINDGAEYTNTPSVMMTLSATDGGSGVYQMRLSDDGSTWANWQPYETSWGWGFSGGDGIKTLYVQYKDNAGNVSSTYSDTILLDTTAPTGTIIINSGAAYTNTASVFLTLTATDGNGSDVSQMCFSNDGGTWSSWEPYSTSKTWTLGPGDGEKSVFVRYKDNVGAESVSYFDTIILDTTGPTGTISINGEAAYTNSTSVTLTLSATDGGGSGVSEMMLCNEGSSCSSSSWETYGTSKAWSLSPGDGAKTVLVWYKDHVGFVSISFSDTIILDTAAPTGTIDINSGATYTNTTLVTLTISAADGSGSGISQMQFSNDGSTWSGWEAYGTSRAWTLTSGDGTKTIYVQYKDNAGNVSGNYTDTIVLDTAPPVDPTTVVSSSHGVATWSNNRNIAMNWSGASDALSGVNGYSYVFDQSTSTVPDTTLDTTGTTATSSALTDGNNWYFHLRTRDDAGNWTSTVHAGPYYIDGTPPTNPTSATEIHGAANNIWQGSISDPAFTWSGASDSLSGLGGYYVYFGTDPNGTSSTFVTAAAYDPPAVTDGTYYLRVKAKDNAGNEATSWVALFTFRYDAAPPTNPTSAAETNGAPNNTWQNTVSDPAFTWSGASDPGSGLAGYYVYWGTDPNGTSSTFVTSTAYDPSSVTDGTHYLRVKAKDNVGNEASSWATVFTFKYDVTVPTNPASATETHGVGNDTWQGSVSDPAFTWTGASDSGSGVKGYYWYFGTDPSGDPTNWTTTAGCDPAAVSSGTYYLRLKTEDTAGNRSNAATLFTFKYDGAAPTDPATVASTSHTLSTWSGNRNIAMAWYGATDAHSGIAGYSYEFSQSASTIPDTTVDTTGTTAASSSLADGNNWYFHIRTRDNAGNWTSTVHVGPYYIDGTAPSNPTSATETHGAPNNTWQNNVSDPAFTWTGALDSGSGVKGYYWYFGSDPGADPATWATPAGCDPAGVSSGTYYLRVKTEDNAGNRSSAVTLFTFKYDDVAPTSPKTFSSASHALGTWSNNRNIAMNWSDATDDHSGVAGYSYEFTQSPSTLPDSDVDTTGTTATSSSLADGNNWYFHLRTKDNAGNWTIASHVGPYYIDGTPPNNPSSALETHGAPNNTWQSTVNDPGFTWAGATDAGSGVAGYYVYWGTDSGGTSSTFVTTETYDPPAVTEGTYYLRAKTKDNAGNEASSWATIFTFKYDTTVPTNPTSASETHGAPNNTWQNMVSDPSFTWTGASDSGSGVKGYYWYFGTNPSGDPTNWTTDAGCNPASVLSGTYYLRVKTEDNGGMSSSAVTLFTFRYDGDPPASGTISINSGAATTTSLTVTLNSLGATDSSPLTQMTFSNNASGPWSDPEAYATTKTGWNLSAYGGSSSPGTKTVYVKYQDSAGNWSSAFSDDIQYLPVQAFPFRDDFSTDKGWSGYEPGGWERKPAKAGGGANGNPDPGSDYTGEGYILGFAIGGDYPNNLTEKSVISPPIDCSGAANVFLKFRRWLNVESNKSDFAMIDVSADGSTWEALWENPGYDLTDSKWTLVVFDISEIAAHQPTVYIKFTMGPTNPDRPFSGWNIDDLEVTSESIYPAEGTVGTQITIPGSGFGVKKGKVLIQGQVLDPKKGKVKTVKATLAIGKDGKIWKWTDTRIVGKITKAVPSGVYDVIIQPKGTAPIEHKAAFSVVRPEIESVSPERAKYVEDGSEPVTVTGKYFGTVRGILQINYWEEGGKEMHFTWPSDSWTMDEVTGESIITFKAPCDKKAETKCFLKILNKAGEDTEEDGFTISQEVKCPAGVSSDPSGGW